MAGVMAISDTCRRCAGVARNVAQRRAPADSGIAFALPLRSNLNPDRAMDCCSHLSVELASNACIFELVGSRYLSSSHLISMPKQARTQCLFCAQTTGFDTEMQYLTGSSIDKLRYRVTC